MSDFDVLVIGGGIAGVQAAITAKKSEPRRSVGIVSLNPLTYPRPDPIDVLHGFTQSASEIKRYGFKDLENIQIKLLEGRKAMSVDHDRRVALIENPANRRRVSIGYSNLIISTGSIPVVPPIRGREKRGVFAIKWFNDALALSRYASPGMKTYVVGASLIGLEVAEALVQLGVKVFLVEKESHALSKLCEPDLSEAIVQRAVVHGVNPIMGATIDEIEGKRKVEYIIINGRKFDADIVVFTAGSGPNTTIATEMGVQLGKNNAIGTDNRMRTNLEDVHTAGDCAETIDYISGTPVYRPLGSIAAQGARIAGSNAAGLDASYNGFIRIQYTRVFGIDMGMIGLTAYEASDLGISAETFDFHMKSRKYALSRLLLPTKASMKVTINRNDDTVIGWQVVGFGRNAWVFWPSMVFLELIRERRTLSEALKFGYT